MIKNHEKYRSKNIHKQFVHVSNLFYLKTKQLRPLFRQTNNKIHEKKLKKTKMLKEIDECAIDMQRLLHCIVVKIILNVSFGRSHC